MLSAHRAYGSQPEYAPSSLMYSPMSSPHSMPIQPGMQTHSCRFGPRSSQVPRIGSQSSRSVQVRPSPSQPDRQRQNQSPGTFTQRVSTWQSWVLEVHSR